MIKTFCDICESETTGDSAEIFSLHPIGNSVVAFKDGCERELHPSAKIVVSFGWWDHQYKANGRPVDLCTNCQIKLVKELIRSHDGSGDPAF